MEMKLPPAHSYFPTTVWVKKSFVLFGGFLPLASHTDKQKGTQEEQFLVPQTFIILT